MYWISAGQGPATRFFSVTQTTLLCQCLALLGAALVNAQLLTNGQIAVISARLAEAAQASWELGTRAQAILELNATQYSVFSASPLPPPPTIPKSLVTTQALTPFFDIARTLVYNRSIEQFNVTGPRPFMPDGSAGDPSSMGVAVLLANWTGQDSNGGQINYGDAAKDQVDFLLNVVNRTSDGAISHRTPEVQLWSDFIYMVPPFLAYYGVLTRNRTIVAESYNQIKLYRGHLRDNSTGLWQHVMLGPDWDDPGFWCTGQGWAAAGMLRVYSTIHHSEYSNTFEDEKSDLASWITEVHTAVYPHLDDSNIFLNYPDQPINGTENFYDAACTTLLASTVYRAAVVINDNSHIPFADRSRKTLFSPGSPSSSSTTTTTTSSSSSSSSSSASSSSASSSSSSNSSSSTPSTNFATDFTTSSTTPDFTTTTYTHFTPDGWLQPVVDPHSFRNPGNHSAEGQAFVVQLHAAYRDYLAGVKTSAAVGRVGVGTVVNVVGGSSASGSGFVIMRVAGRCSLSMVSAVVVAALLVVL